MKMTMPRTMMGFDPCIDLYKHSPQETMTRHIPVFNVRALCTLKRMSILC